MKKALISFLVSALIIASLGLILYFVPISYAPLNNLIVNGAQKKTSLDITYARITIWPLRRVEIKDLSVSDKKIFTLTSREAVFDYNIFTLLKGFIYCRIQLKDATLEGHFAGGLVPFASAVPSSSLVSARSNFSDIGADFKVYVGKIVTDNLVINGRTVSLKEASSILNYVQ